MKRRLFLAGGTAALTTVAGPAVGKDRPKPLEKGKAIVKGKTIEVELYTSRNKGAFVVVFEHEGRKRWGEVRTHVTEFPMEKPRKITTEAGAFVVQQDKDGAIVIEDDAGQPVARLFGFAVFFFLGFLLMWAKVADHRRKEKAKKAKDEWEKALAEISGDGFWDDGSDHCNPGPLDPPVLC